MAARRSNHEVELEHACRWATGWLHAARRLAPAASRPEGVLLLESGSGPSVESVHSQALELAMRRAGLHVLALSADLAESRFQSAIRALRPAAVVLCGAEARLDVVGTRLRSILNERDGSRLFGYRTARLVSGRRGAPVLGSSPFEATANLIAALEQPAAAAGQLGQGAQRRRARASA
jgi:hypothetical protein